MCVCWWWGGGECTYQQQVTGSQWLMVEDSRRCSQQLQPTALKLRSVLTESLHSPAHRALKSPREGLEEASEDEEALCLHDAPAKNLLC